MFYIILSLEERDLRDIVARLTCHRGKLKSRYLSSRHAYLGQALTSDISAHHTTLRPDLARANMANRGYDVVVDVDEGVGKCPKSHQ